MLLRYLGQPKPSCGQSLNIPQVEVSAPASTPTSPAIHMSTSPSLGGFDDLDVSSCTFQRHERLRAAGERPEEVTEHRAVAAEVGEAGQDQPTDPPLHEHEEPVRLEHDRSRGSPDAGKLQAAQERRRLPGVLEGAEEGFRGDVCLLLTRAPKGWQWTGVAISEASDLWQERWRPATRKENQPLPFPLLAPWPAGVSFTAGGLTQFIAQQPAIAAAGPFFGGLLALAFARNRCGFGPRGLYCNQTSTHEDENAFAIDFARYRRNVPYDNESEGTPVLAARGGVVARVSAGTGSGSSPSNTVEVNHQDPGNPTDLTRFRSLYLHLAGPFRIPCPR